jgi:acetyl esterase
MISNIPYGPHPKHVIDLHLAPQPGPRPFYLYIHGGGFVGGDKTSLPQSFIHALLSRGISVASMNYRFTDDPELFAPLNDAVRALQFLRHYANHWNLDPLRVGSGGGSAGSVSAFWLGLHPDKAIPSSPDPIARQSTRLRVISSWETQTSLDPQFIKSIIPGQTWAFYTIAKLIQVPMEQYDTPLARERFKLLHFPAMVDIHTPPTHIFNITKDLPLIPDLAPGPGIHHPRFASAYKEYMDKAGVECIIRKSEDLPKITNDTLLFDKFADEAGEFLAKWLIPGQ